MCDVAAEKQFLPGHGGKQKKRSKRNLSYRSFKENEKQGMKLNIEKFKEVAPKEVKEMEKVLKNRKTYEKLLATKLILSTAIPVALM